MGVSKVRPEGRVRRFSCGVNLLISSRYPCTDTRGTSSPDAASHVLTPSAHQECLEYVLYKEAGSSDVRFQGGLKRDCDAEGNVHTDRLVRDLQTGEERGMRFDDFLRCASRLAGQNKFQRQPMVEV